MQSELDATANAESMLEVAVGDHLLLPQGNRDVLCKVRKVESTYVTVQYYKRQLEKTTKKTSAMCNLELVWWRQNPKKTEEAIEKTLAPFLTKAQVKKGYEPWQEKIHINLFYQRRLESSDLTVRKSGVSIKPLRYAAIRKASPMVPQSDSIDYGGGVEVAVAESKSKSTGGRLIVLGDKQSKAQYIRRRCKLVSGSSIKHPPTQSTAPVWISSSPVMTRRLSFYVTL